jgi:2-haloacid dehalogenase
VAVRALVFDVFGTLVDWRSTVAEAFAASPVPGDPAELADEWRERFWPAANDVNTGARPWLDFDELHLATLGELLSERSVELPHEQQRRLLAAWHRLDPWPDVCGGLEALRVQRVVGALSNGNTALLIDLARHGDLRFDCLLSAELVQAYKPAPTVYELAPRLLRVEPAEVMLVAAHPMDLKGARNAGLRSAFVDRPLEHGSDSPRREDPDADYSVADLDELAAQLAA